MRTGLTLSAANSAPLASAAQAYAVAGVNECGAGVHEAEAKLNAA
jgi:hypothetical protein